MFLILVVLVIGTITTFGVAAGASLLAAKSSATQYMIVDGRAGWPVDGSIAVQISRGMFRTDLSLDPGPYPVAQRERTLRQFGRVPIAGGVGDRPAPLWLRELARNHAGPRFSGWQAEVAAFGWPAPVLYWKWDWQSESVSGGLVPGSAAAQLRPKDIPAHALPFKVSWPGMIYCLSAHWGLMAGMLLAGAAARRISRTRRGCCHGCGYHRTGLAAGACCPECGCAPLRPAVAVCVRGVGALLVPVGWLLAFAALGLASAWGTAAALALRGVNRTSVSEPFAAMRQPSGYALAFRPIERGIGWRVRESIAFIPHISDTATLWYTDPYRPRDHVALPRVENAPDNRPDFHPSEGTLTEFGFGFPFIGLSSTVTRDLGLVSQIPDGLLVRAGSPAALMFERGPRAVALPRPLILPTTWQPGMWSNTAAHGATWLVLFVLAVRLRRALATPDVASAPGSM